MLSRCALSCVAAKGSFLECLLYIYNIQKIFPYLSWLDDVRMHDDFVVLFEIDTTVDINRIAIYRRQRGTANVWLIETYIQNQRRNVYI